MALASLGDDELQALIDATHKVRQVAPGLLAWIDAACEWELNHRAGLAYKLQPPEAAIPDEEDGVAIDAAFALRAKFAMNSHAVRAFFGALAALLTSDGRKH